MSGRDPLVSSTTLLSLSARTITGTTGGDRSHSSSESCGCLVDAPFSLASLCSEIRKNFQPPLVQQQPGSLMDLRSRYPTFLSLALLMTSEMAVAKAVLPDASKRQARSLHLCSSTLFSLLVYLDVKDLATSRPRFGNAGYCQASSSILFSMTFKLVMAPPSESVSSFLPLP